MPKRNSAGPIIVGGPVNAAGNPDGSNGGSGDSGSVGSDGIITLNPADINGSASSGSGGGDGGASTGEPKRRTRGPNRTRAGSQKGTLSVDALTNVLFGTHAMLAAITQTAELQLDAEEASQLAKASAAVMAYYPSVQMAEKTMTWINLIMVCGTIYGSRAVAIRFRMKNEKAGAAPVREAPRQATPQPAAPPRQATPATGEQPGATPPNMQYVDGVGWVTTGDKPN